MYFNLFLALIISLSSIHVETKSITCSLEDSRLAVPNDCSGYMQCNNGKLNYVNCPMFKLFDNVVMECEWRWKVDCGAVPPPFPPATWRPDP
uniref:Secreted Chitin binding peritrophin-like protein n=1 Tax=Pristhesancus plagipennis TaxID=1955184 RepID=A0A2K8JS37_PRIPG|nr:secreted Chitin binding peritrophin-like protein [Pristhesancus plagipennis]